jgi:putative ATPase
MSNQPLASLLRPHSLADFVGQSHLVGEGQPLRLAIDNHQIFSMIFWGPPGVGKTTLAKIIAHEAQAELYEMSAVSASKDDIKKILGNSVETRHGTSLPLIKKILFLDEIHRFNKAQQDFLLPYVESGRLTLIGATTENPSFEVISPLLSRCRVFTLKELSDEEMGEIINRSIKIINSTFFSKSPLPKGDLGGLAKIKINKEARDWLIRMANGDARQAITMLDNAFTLYQKITIDTLKSTLQNSFLRFDKKGEEHFNTISAFIKSMRASNVSAALYYLARMVDAGEDPLFIARRMVVFASEDVASPTALVVANAVFQACQQIGYPECQENLAAGVAYLTQSPKDRRAYDGFMAAMVDVKTYGNLPIPMNLRNAPTKLMKDLGYGKGYDKYTTEDLLPEKLKGKKYFKELKKK